MYTDEKMMKESTVPGKNKKKRGARETESEDKLMQTVLFGGGSIHKEEKIPRKKVEVDEPEIKACIKEDERENYVGKMRIMTLNVAGALAAVKKGLTEYLKTTNADVVCMQETKLNTIPPAKDVRGNPNTAPFSRQEYPYQAHSISTLRKGYSGVSIISRVETAGATIYGIGDDSFDAEGRCVSVEYPNFYLVVCYAPNSGSELKRLGYKREWSHLIEKLLQRLQGTGKGVIFTGDMNVARTEFDLARPKQNENNAGFTKEEREDIERVLKNTGMYDIYRELHPNTPGYTYFSYRANSRANNVGWRLDYFFATQDLKNNIKACEVLDAKTNDNKWVSDHLPLVIDLDFGSDGC